MDIEKYDFESALEAGFKTLFDAAGLALRVADDIGQGELPDERITLEIDTGGPISDEHQNAQGIYDNYAGTIAVEIHTPRVPNDQTAAAIQQIDSDVYTVYGAGTKDANGLYVRNGNSADGNPAYTLYDSDGTTALYNMWSLLKGTWYISSSDIDDIDGLTNEAVYAHTTPSPTPSESGWVSADPLDTAPTVSKATAQTGFRSRHRELVATVRKTLEEIDAAALATNWPGALSPTKITPTSTDRENDQDSQMTTLNYLLQFRIA